MAIATPTYEKEYSHEEGNFTLKIWIPSPGKILVVPTSQKGTSMPIAHPAFYACQVTERGTIYNTRFPYEIEHYFCEGEWEEGKDFWEELKARQLV